MGKTTVRKHSEHLRKLDQAKRVDTTDVEAARVASNVRENFLGQIGDQFITPEQLEHRDKLLPRNEGVNAAGAERRQVEPPTLLVSAQVAAVLNMGIDRAIDVANETANRVQHLEYVVDTCHGHNRRLREFIRNVATGDWSQEDIVWGAQRMLEEPRA